MGYCVYKHTAPNGKVYIGITGRSPRERWRNGNGYYQNTHFKNAIEAYGWDNFQHEILFDGISKEEACEIEKYLIKKYKSNIREHGYNNSSGGENPAEGVKHSAETKAKQSDAHKNYRPSDETRKKISNSKKGKPNGREGKFGADSGKAGIVRMIDEKTNKTIASFHGYCEMHRKTGYAQTPVKEAVSGKRKRAYGYLWEYEKRGITNVSF